MTQIISFNELSSFGKIEALANIPVIATDQELRIKYTNSTGENLLALEKIRSIDKEKFDLKQLFTGNNHYKWEKVLIEVENETWSVYIGKPPSSELNFNNSNNLNSIIENFPELVYWKDRNLLYQGCNTNAANILGYKSSLEIIGKSDSDLAKEFNWSEERVKKLYDTDTTIIKQAIGAVEEDSIAGHDDTKIYLTSKKPLFNNGEVVGILGISTDITQNKTLEEALRTAKEKNEIYLHGIVENLPQLVYWKDKNFIYQGCNKLCAEVLNLQKPAQIVGKSDNDFGWSKERIEELRDVDRKIIKDGVHQVVEDIIPIKNSNRVFLTSKTPLIDKNGDIIGVLGISTDITDRKKIEEDLKKAKEAAEAGEKAKTAFIANMSHDLRTPLTGIIGEAYMLKGDVTDAERIQYANELGKSGEKLLKMYNEIIEDVRSDHMSDKDIETNTLDLNELLTELKDTVQPTFTWKNLTLNMAVDPAIPVFLVSDRRKIFRIIENLVGNAMKFTDKGHINLKVDLLEKQKYTVKIQVNVIDTGIGIPDNKKSQLFERFYKVSPSHKGEYEGFGLGLNIAKNYTNMLNGTIGFESTEGVGSNFYVILTIKIATEDEIATYKKKLSKPKPALLKGNENPIAESTKDSKPIKKPQISCEETATSSVTQTRNNAPHILVIEDNLVARNITVIFIKQANLNVTEVTDGEAALKLAKKQEFDLILADVGLPGISGIEVTQQLRQFEKEQGRKPIPIIGITAHAADGQKECIDAGMNEALAKPFTPDMLREIIKIYLPDYQNTKK